MADPTAVPDTYSMNTDLTWVQKSTHIWSVHPSDPLKADKGGMALQVVGGGSTPPVAIPAENVMEIQGGFDGGGAGNWYQTVATMIWGDDPLTTGNQTPPMVGGMSCWVRFSGFANYMGIIGGHPPVATSMANSAGIIATGGGVLAGVINGFSFGPTVTTGVWMHLALQNNGTSHRLYMNGAVAAAPGNSSIVSGDYPFDIGMNMWAATANRYVLYGRIRQVAVINGANWTDAEVLEMYQRPFAYYAPAAVVVPPVEIRLGNPQLIAVV